MKCLLSFYDQTRSQVVGRLTEVDLVRVHSQLEGAGGRLEVEGLPLKEPPLGAPCDVVLQTGEAQWTGKGRCVARRPVRLDVLDTLTVDLEPEEEKPPTSGEVVDLTPYVFEVGSTQKSTPWPSGLRLILQAEWLQQASGQLDIGPYLAAAFPRGKINSLNARLRVAPMSLRTGYTPLKAEFERVTPPSTGMLNCYPTTMPPLTCGRETVVLPRYWFRADWVLYWSYEQKRIEKLTVEYPLGAPGGEPLEMTLKVGDVSALQGFTSQRATLLDDEGDTRSQDEVSSSLWTNIVEGAMECVGQELEERFSSSVTCKIPLEKGLALPLEQAVIAGEVAGRISRKSFVLEGAKRYAEITVRSDPPWLRAWRTQKWRLEALRHRTPLEGLTETAMKVPADWVDFSVENDAEEQWGEIQRAQPATQGALKALLRNHATQVRVQLRSLKTTRCLTHEVEGQIVAA